MAESGTAKHGAMQLMQLLQKGMTPQHKLLAHFFLNYLNEAIFLTVSEVAKRASTSESTVVRFARSLGYPGYPEFQHDLQALVRQKLAPVERLKRAGAVPDSLEALWDRVAAVDIENLNETRKHLTPENLEAAACVLIGAKQKFIVGLRFSSAAATLLAHYLMQIQSQVRAVTDAGPGVFEALTNVTSDDAVIAISYPRYTRWTIEGLQYARDHGAKTIAITDSRLSPAAQIADIVLVGAASSITFGSSYAGVTLVIDGLVAAILSLDSKGSLDRLNLFEQALSGRDFFYSDLNSTNGNQKQLHRRKESSKRKR